MICDVVIQQLYVYARGFSGGGGGGTRSPCLYLHLYMFYTVRPRKNETENYRCFIVT